MQSLKLIIAILIFAGVANAHPMYDAIGGNWAGSGIVNYGGDFIASTTYTLTIDENGFFRDHRIDVDENGDLVQEFRVAVEYTPELGAAKMSGRVADGNDSIFEKSNGFCLINECTFIYQWSGGDLAHVNVRKINENSIVVNKQVISRESDIFYYMQSHLTRVVEPASSAR
ncbi:MAG: hypothetical protein CL677_03360 [Bdellovibrionaceae bacterium]|nr:hypothetical protein [Pseudobdellovibrionaceae bacterium]|tara:strand:+ start:5223 stop:5735 length:513 start_codon:yes stop_codon:yes gene_type:complete